MSARKPAKPGRRMSQRVSIRSVRLGDVPLPDGRQVVLDSMSERAWHQHVVGMARFWGWAIFHDNATNAPRKCPKCGEYIKQPRNVHGFPDLLLLKEIKGRTRLVVAELKSETGVVSAAQEGWLALFRQIPGAEVHIWRPRDQELVIRTLAA